MEHGKKIITVGLAPAWDVQCRGQGLDWGRHANIDEQDIRAAGKALNVSYALAWLGRSSVAAGLWGRADYEPMQAAVQRLGSVRVAMTAVVGHTRHNVTVLDTRNGREMHLRLPSALASAETLDRLDADLKKLVGAGDTCIFAGSMPAGDLLDRGVAVVHGCRAAGARIVLDTHGPALHRLVDAGSLGLIAPNVEELAGLLGREIEDAPGALAAAGGTLLDRVELVLISRGAKGAVLVTASGAWEGRNDTQGHIVSTVGCGDYLLAGFLAGLDAAGEPPAALAAGLKVAAARAWGWTKTKTWPEAERMIKTVVAPV
ncbi:MAG: hypothetical protein JW741_23460 [Sedimentisphaerales bacterium]|nr:hypothetical protein [Sedimentisphaerales bacterium]